MSASNSKYTFVSYFRGVTEWLTVDNLAEIPPSNDALNVQIVFFKEIQHGFGTPEDGFDRFGIRQSEKVITIRPSELCNEDTTSIKQSYSIRMIEDIINTQFPPSEKDIDLPLIVDRIVELVQNLMIGSPPDLPPNRVLVVRLLDGIMIGHDTSDKKRVLDYAEETRRGTCSICMDDFEVGRNGSRLPCLHSFHGRCIFNWLHRKHHCPICRYEVPAQWITWF